MSPVPEKRVQPSVALPHRLHPDSPPTDQPIQPLARDRNKVLGGPILFVPSLLCSKHSLGKASSTSTQLWDFSGFSGQTLKRMPTRWWLMGPLNEVKVSGMKWRLGLGWCLVHWFFPSSLSSLVRDFLHVRYFRFRSPSARTLAWPQSEAQGYRLRYSTQILKMWQALSSALWDNF